MSCLYGAVVSQRNCRGAFNESVPRLVLDLPLLTSVTCCSKLAETAVSPLEKASRRDRAVSAAAPVTAKSSKEAKAKTRMVGRKKGRRGKYPETELNVESMAVLKPRAAAGPAP